MLSFSFVRNEGCWIMFVEIKDCKPKNIAVYKEKCKSQLVSTIQDFRKHNLISDTNKVHAVISFPAGIKLLLMK